MPIPGLKQINIHYSPPGKATIYTMPKKLPHLKLTVTNKLDSCTLTRIA
jgi:hypothetical protein